MRTDLNQEQQKQILEIFGDCYNAKEAAIIIRKFIYETMSLFLRDNENFADKENIQKGHYLLNQLVDIVDDRITA